jgi:hypothetical protein
MRTLTRWLPGLVLAGLMAVVSLAPASAATAPGRSWPAPVAAVTAHVRAPQLGSNQGVVIAHAGLNVRGIKVGQTPSTNLPVVGHLAYNQVVTIRCYYTGQTITGPYGPTNVWDSIIGYQTNQYDGIASDAWIYTGSNTPRVPACGGP